MKNNKVEFIRKAFSGSEIKKMIKEELVNLEPVWIEIGTLIESLHKRVSELEESVNTLIKTEKEKDGK